MMATVVLLVRLARILLLDLCRIRQHQRAQIFRPGCAEHAPPKASGHQTGQISAVIEVSVSQDHRVNGGRRDWKWLPVALTQLFESLEKPAIDEESMVAEIEQVF